MDLVYAQMIKDILLEKSRSEDTFIIVDDKVYTFNMFSNLIDGFIQQVAKCNNKINRITIDYAANIDILVSIIGCNRLNIIPILLPPENRRLKNVNYSEISNADHLIKDNSCIIQLNDNPCCDSINVDNPIQCVLFTSGSSGCPKAVELTYKNIYSSALNWNKVLGFQVNEYYLNVLPLDHIGGLSIFFRSIYYGFISVVSSYNKSTLLSDIKKYNIDYISVVPKMVSNIIERNEIQGLASQLKTVIVGGDGINQSIFNYFKKNNINAYISYGMTETCSGIAGYFLNECSQFNKGYIGDSHSDVEITLKDNFIQVRSEVVMYGYSGKPKNSKTFITSDVGKIENNQIYFLSRGRDFIISGGENISLLNIKNIINTCTGVLDSVVIGVENEKWGMVPAAVFESSNNETSIKEVSDFCKNNLPNYMVPKYFININKIPYKNNKIDYNLIRHYVNKSVL